MASTQHSHLYGTVLTNFRYSLEPQASAIGSQVSERPFTLLSACDEQVSALKRFKHSVEPGWYRDVSFFLSCCLCFFFIPALPHFVDLDRGSAASFITCSFWTRAQVENVCFAEQSDFANVPLRTQLTAADYSDFGLFEDRLLSSRYTGRCLYRLMNTK